MEQIIIGGSRRARLGIELEDLSLVPSRRTRDPELVDVSWQLDAYRFEVPVIAAPLDSVVSPATAALMAELGGVGVLNLEGLWCRYDDPEQVLAEIATLEPGPGATTRLQQLYAAPVREELIGARIAAIREATGFAAGSFSPQKVERYHHAALEAGLDLLVVHGSAVTAQHVGRPDATPLDLRSFTARYDIPVLVGGVWSARTAIHLMRTGAVGVIVDSGVAGTVSAHPALGIGLALGTALAEVAEARSRYLAESGRYVQVIAAGGLRTGGDLAKAIACGADAVMLGRALAAADEAPAGTAHWGLAAAHHDLPRSRFEQLEPVGGLRVVLRGPAHRDDGQVNLIGGLTRAMGATGYETLRRLHDAELAVHLGALPGAARGGGW